MKNENVNSSVPSCGDVTQRTSISKQLTLRNPAMWVHLCFQSWWLPFVICYGIWFNVIDELSLSSWCIAASTSELVWCSMSKSLMLPIANPCNVSMFILCRCCTKSSSRRHCVQLRSLCRITRRSRFFCIQQFVGVVAFCFNLMSSLPVNNHVVRTVWVTSVTD